MPLLCGLTTEPFLFLQAGIFSLNSVVVPQFLQDRVCRNLYNATVCDTLSTNTKTPHEDHIQEVASFWMAILTISSQTLMMICTCFVGQLADTLGKRRVMISSPVFSLIQAIMFIALSKVRGYLHPALVFLPLMCWPLTGDIQGALLLALAYKADVTKVEERTKEMARTEGFLFFAFTVVILLSGVILKLLSYTAVFAASAAISTISLLYVTLILPDEKVVAEQNEESYPILEREQRSNLSEDYSDEKMLVDQQRSKSMFNLQRIRKVLTTRLEGHTIRIYLVFLGLAVFSNQGFLLINVLYFSHSPFNLRKDQLGYLIACYGLMAAFGDWFMVPLLQRFARFKDIELIISGFAAVTVGFTLLGTAKASWMLFMYSVLAPFMVFPLSVTRSIMTKHVSDDLHGTVLTTAELVDSVASLITGFLCNFIYSKTVSFYPGTVMLMLALGGLLGFCCSLAFRLWKQRKDLADNR